jgi:hypothetical protein
MRMRATRLPRPFAQSIFRRQAPREAARHLTPWSDLAREREVSPGTLRTLAQTSSLPDLVSWVSPADTGRRGAETLAGGLYTLAYRRIRDSGPESLPSLAPLCTYIALSPFIGPEEACRWPTVTGGGAPRVTSDEPAAGPQNAGALLERAT